MACQPGWCGVQAGMSEGTLDPASQQQEHDPKVAPYDTRWQVRWQRRQQGVLRYNCADSLDRTNAASYFAAVQVGCPQGRSLCMRELQ